MFIVLFASGPFAGKCSDVCSRDRLHSCASMSPRCPLPTLAARLLVSTVPILAFAVLASPNRLAESAQGPAAQMLTLRMIVVTSQAAADRIVERFGSDAVRRGISKE